MKSIKILIALILFCQVTNGQKLSYLSSYFPANPNTGSGVITNDYPGTIDIQKDKSKIVISNTMVTEVYKIKKITTLSDGKIQYDLETELSGDIVPFTGIYDAFYLKFTMSYEFDTRVYLLKDE